PPIFDPKAYPLRNFTTFAEDLDGFSPPVLAAMDRDVLTTEEWEQIKAAVNGKGSAPGTSAVSATSTRPAKDPVPAQAAVQPSSSQSDSRTVTSASSPTERKTGKKTVLRYSGKSFNEWRDVLLTD